MLDRKDHSHPKTALDYLRLYLTGFAMGAADIVPGVSGGTMAFILGVYEDLINGIKSFNLDAIKLALKEDIVPAGANKWLHGIAPMITVIVALSTFAVIPFSLDVQLFGDTYRLQVADLNFGIIYILAISSISVYSGTLAGWSSNNKYSLLGELR